MKFFFGFLAFIAAIVVVVLLVTGVVRTTSTSNNSPVTQTITLTDDSVASSVVRYTTTTPIVANENYRETRLTVSQNVRTIEVIKGYDRIVETSVSLPNTREAYKAFLGALTAAKFSNKRDITQGDIKSTCVTGSKYLYELSLGSAKKVDTWTTSCTSANGNFAGNVAGVDQIFRDQFPNYGQVVTSPSGTYSLAPL